jgi:hypothetical protein
MKIKNITTKVLLGITFFLLSTISAHAAGFGVSPTDIYNEYLAPGMTFEKEFTLSRSGSLEELDIYIEPDLGDITSWFTFSPGSVFKFEQGEDIKTFRVIVNVPQDAEYTEYDGVVRVKAVPSSEEIKGVSITQGVRLDAGLIVTEVVVRKLAILSIDALDAIVGEPVQIELLGENQGNTDVSPTIKAKIMDLNMNILEEHDLSDFGVIEAGKTSTLTAQLPTSLPVGEYFVEVQVLLDGEELRTERVVFNIREAEVEEDEDQNIPLIAGIIDFFRNNRAFVIVIFIAILLAIIIEILTYILTGKLWEKEKMEKHREKPWAILLGSKQLTRAALSFAVGFIILLGILLYPTLTMEVKEVSEETPLITEETGETQGVQDTDFSLNVFPSIEVPRYVVYVDPDTTSEIVYTAMENEEFDVIEETEGWYKVSLEDGNTGWLEKRVVKSER